MLSAVEASLPKFLRLTSGTLLYTSPNPNEIRVPISRGFCEKVGF